LDKEGDDMKTGIVRLSVLSMVVLACFAAGCARDENPESKPPDKAPGVVDVIADEVTGYRAVKQGQQVKEKLRKIEAQRNEQMEGILDDTDSAKK
jgi:hypothetical protein